MTEWGLSDPPKRTGAAEVDRQRLLEQFLTTMHAQRSLNLPELAATIQIDFEEVERELKKGGIFYRKVKESLERIKFDLWDTVLRMGRDGKASGQRSSDLAAIRFIIEEIESGRVLAKYEKQELSKTDVKNAMSKLNLGKSKKSS